MSVAAAIDFGPVRFEHDRGNQGLSIGCNWSATVAIDESLIIIIIESFDVVAEEDEVRMTSDDVVMRLCETLALARLVPHVDCISSPSSRPRLSSPPPASRSHHHQTHPNLSLSGPTDHEGLLTPRLRPQGLHSRC